MISTAIDTFKGAFLGNSLSNSSLIGKACSKGLILALGAIFTSCIYKRELSVEEMTLASCLLGTLYAVKRFERTQAAKIHSILHKDKNSPETAATSAPIGHEPNAKVSLKGTEKTIDDLGQLKIRTLCPKFSSALDNLLQSAPNETELDSEYERRCTKEIDRILKDCLEELLSLDEDQRKKVKYFLMNLQKNN